MVTLKSDDDIKWMRHSGTITAAVLRELAKNCQEGICLNDLDRMAESMIKKMGAVPAFKNYRGYPKTITVSINEQVVHGIPGKRRIRKGDLVSFDMGAYYKGHCSDSALSVLVGDSPDPEDLRLLETTKESLYEGISKFLPENHLGDISNAVQSYAEGRGFSVVRDLVGHGIGRQMHEDPPVPNYGRPGRGLLLQKGLVLAIEPMINAGVYDVIFLDDGWTVITADGRKSAHFEHTVALTDKGPRILTLPEDATEEEEYPLLSLQK